jgi:hypothetical protein
MNRETPQTNEDDGILGIGVDWSRSGQKEEPAPAEAPAPEEVPVAEEVE